MSDQLGPGAWVFSWHLGTLSLYQLVARLENASKAGALYERHEALPIVLSGRIIYWSFALVETFPGRTVGAERVLDLIEREYDAECQKIDADTYLIRRNNV